MRLRNAGSAPIGRSQTLTWPIVIGLSLAPAAGNGFGRFAYGLVLPAMRHALGWSALAAGSLSAANAAGYLLGAMVADRVLLRLGERAAVLCATLVVALAVGGCAATASLPLLLALRLLAGAAAAVAFIAGGAVVARLAHADASRAAGRFLGLYFAGPGLGIAVSAPLITPIATGGSWRACWVVLGALCVACLLIAAGALHRLDTNPAAPRIQRGSRPWRKRRLTALLVSYCLFGSGYIAFTTFAVAYLRDTGHPAAQITLFWFTLGMAGIAIALLCVAPLSRIGDGRGVACLVGVAALAAALPLLSPALAVALLSAALFGSFLSVTSVATACMQHQLPPSEWPPAIAGLTVAFGIGQCLGPILSGALSDGPQGLRAGLLTGVVLLALSAGCALFQKRGDQAGGHQARATSP